MTAVPELAFPAVLKGSAKQKVPPPVPPRGSPKAKRGGGSSSHGSSSLDTKGLPLSCSSTPPPPFEEAPAARGCRTDSSSTTSSSASAARRPPSAMTASSGSSLAVHAGRLEASVCWTPPASSAEGSTPTWTEGTPSFTESSSSDQGYPATPQRSATPRRRPPPAAALASLTTEMNSQVIVEMSKVTMSRVHVQMANGEVEI